MKECGKEVKNMGRENIDGRTKWCLKVNFG